MTLRAYNVFVKLTPDKKLILKNRACRLKNNICGFSGNILINREVQNENKSPGFTLVAGLDVAVSAFKNFFLLIIYGFH